MIITESLRFVHPYNQPGRTLVATRTDGNITLELDGPGRCFAFVELPATAVMDEITPTRTPYVWAVWLDDTPVHVAEGDAKAIQRMVERALAGAEPAL